MKKKLKRIIWGFVLVVITAIVIFKLLQPLKAEMIEVEPRTISQSFTEEGVVVPILERELYSLLGGKVIDLAVEEGQDVKKGDLLLQLDTEEIRFQLAQLRGQLASVEGQEKQVYREPLSSQVSQQKLAIEQAKIQLEAAKSEFERVQVLFQAGAVSKEIYDEAERSVKQMENLLSQQEQALQLIREQQNPPSGTKEQFSGLKQSLLAQIALLEYQEAKGSLYAPMDGKVKGLHIKEGMVIPPGSPVMTLFQPGQYEVETYLLTEDIVDIIVGMKVKATQEKKTEDVSYDGVVTRIAPSAEEKVSALGLVEQRVKVTVQLEGEMKNLRPGYTLDVEFITHTEEGKLVVPKTSLFPYESGDALWVVRDGKAIVQPVKTGLETDEEVVIEEGLQQGDQVIRNPQLEGLKEGKKVVRR
ncbi:HlyD family efflux transporter periplasmic adaptor subunit [Microaerobacter geothermalis]|uniref:efflux RND transporter periplasmic adaptor subunit n=1 Tax=Microaerobacter geothermalis TaxID=674972 RepID=UPI001F2AC06F|nr:HlyD family efflux transporter periplasmic adaptor subunit [Microaerobacter geothermalis]MCF6093059.1 HlyD family efflux transporter periplasmic adaptor subunit [Microaerobacter geothermalis]